MTLLPNSAGERQRLTRSDWILIAICLAIAVVSVAVVARYFESAFPQASIEFRYDRSSSKEIADRLATALQIDVSEMKHASRFDSDGHARIFLERSLGLERANRLMGSDVLVWYWHHRWFRPLVEEELRIDVAPSGEIVGFTHRIPEDAPAPGLQLPVDDPRSIPVGFLRMIGADVDDLRLVEESQRRLPRRLQRSYTFESMSIRPAGAPYRHIVTVDGSTVTSYRQHLDVPDSWLRSYRELRSKNAAAGAVDMLLLAATMIGALVIFIIRLRRGDLALRFTLATGIACVILVGGVALNSIPAQLSYYDTTTSYPAFVGQIALQGIMQSLGTAMLLIVVVGAGEVLYRQRLPTQLAMPRIWSSRALTSRKVFRSLVLGYALVPLFMAYQVSFYLIARHYGAWAPAEVPYDDIVNTALPWVAVLFAGFFPAFSEEFLSRAFSIPFIQRIIRSRVFAIVIAGMIWGFGHATYPNQPFWIRGVEVGLAGIAAGFLMDRYGLLPLLIWHYTIDAVYTATLLFASGNTYYIVSAAVASLLFAFPMLFVIVRYVRNRGFIPDDDLTNASIPIAPAPPPVPHPPAAGFPAAIPPARRNLIIAAVVVVLAAGAWMIRPASPDDAIDYRITKDDAKRVARAHVTALHGNRPIGGTPLGEMRVIAAPDTGFRSWNRDSAREDGGAPGAFDDIAATHLVHSGLPVDDLVALFRDGLEAGTWSVRFFRPMVKEEIFVEVDGRSPRVVGYHKYQDEANPGPSLTREQAAALAQRAFVVYGVDPRGFTLEEALSFQKPRRRDWLFHFQERTPLAERAFRRVTIRVAGAEVTQFNKTIHVPESVYREAQTQTLLNVVLLILKLGGIVALLASVIAGLIIASREGGFFWRRPLRWTALLALVPIAAFATRYESMLFSYSTSVAWETFLVSLITSFVGEVGLQAGVLFLALCGLQAAFPYALDLARHEGRLRFGRSAVIATVTAIAAVTLFETLSVFIAHAFPSAASVSLAVTDQIASPFPALIQTARALIASIVVAGAVALYSLSVRTKRGFVTIAAIFCIALDPAVSTATAPLMLVHALALALVVWLIARYVLDGNPLAWPLAVFTGLTLQSAGTLLQNDRPDLLANGLALAAVAAGALVWAGVGVEGQRRRKG